MVGSPGSVQDTWPCAGTEVFLEQIDCLGPVKYRCAWILMGDWCASNEATQRMKTQVRHQVTAIRFK